MSVSEAENKVKASAIVQSMKFVWQSYKIMIDLVKVNYKMLDVYKTLCEEAFDFMVKYVRTKEAKKVFDVMSGQIKSCQKMEATPQEFEAIPNKIELARYEHVQKMLDLRYSIVDKALKAKFYAECYKAYDDVAYLMKRLEQDAKEMRPMPNTGKYEQKYYVYLSELVWVAGFPLHHAVALYREYNILDMKRRTLPVEDRKLLISRLVMALLATPPHAGSQLSPVQLQKNFRYMLGGETVLSDFDVEAHYNKRMTDLFMVSAIPSRDVIIKDIHRRNLMLFVFPDVSKLFNLLEGEMHTPATFAKEAGVLLEKIVETSSSLGKYTKPVLKTMGTRVIGKMSRYYKRVRLEKLKQWLPTGITDGECEKMIVECSKAGTISAIIDNSNKMLVFQADTTNNLTNRLRLADFAQGLKDAVSLIEQQTKADVLEKAKSRLYNKLVEKVETDKDEVEATVEMLQRQRKEKSEEARAKERAETGYRPEMAVAERGVYKETAKKQRKEMEKERLAKSISELTEQKKQKLKDAILKIKPKIKFGEKKLSTIPTGDITLKDLEGLKETLGKYEERTLTDYIKKEVKKSDVLIRALREEEAKKLLPEWEAQTTKMRELEAKVAEERKKDHQELVNALQNIKETKKEYENQFKDSIKTAHENKLKEHRKKLAEKYQADLLKIAKELMAEDEKRKKEEEEKQKEREKTQEEIGEDKKIKQELPGRKKMFDELPAEEVRITRAAPKKEEPKKEVPAAEEAKKILVRPAAEEEKKRKDLEKEKEVFAPGRSWRTAGKEEKKPEEKKPPVVEKKPSPEKKPVAEAKGGWRRGGEAARPAPKEEKKKETPTKAGTTGLNFRRKQS
eukprot:TRINITY_DN1923_c0_g1_i2.p1 TRINITY_DN1923_c0_g1~~TRINITY_DN1923_c0_g1_i2.p1  ORF type:complete len:848 (-),score=195.93 TRINITY_DN1923_c0_g1_i2:8886-11429(-)